MSRFGKLKAMNEKKNSGFVFFLLFLRPSIRVSPFSVVIRNWSNKLANHTPVFFFQKSFDPPWPFAFNFSPPPPPVPPVKITVLPLRFSRTGEGAIKKLDLRSNENISLHPGPKKMPFSDKKDPLTYEGKKR